MKATFVLASAVAIVVVALAVQSASAEPIPVTVLNYSFEDAAGVSGGLVLAPLDDWTQNAGTQGYSQDGQEADHGTCRGLLSTPSRSGFAGTIWTQVLGDVFKADTIYSLTVAIGGKGPVHESHSGGAYDFSLYAGATELVSGSATNYINTDPMTFKDLTLTYDPRTSGATPTVGTPLEIVLRGISNYDGQCWTAYDNVRLTADLVPEPSTLTMVLFGGMAMVIWARKRRRR